MTKEEHNKLLDDLRKAESDVDRATLLVQLEQDYTSVLTERDSAVTDCQSAIVERDKYAKLNNELWLSNSAQEKAGIETNINTDTTKEEPPKKMTYGDLEASIEEDYKK